MIHRDDIALEIERFASAFEKARAESPDLSPERYFPDRLHGDYESIAVELLRIDLEWRWQQGQPLSLENYCERYPDILSDARRLTLLAFEDYRQRCEAFIDVDREKYALDYGVDVGSWAEPDQVLAANHRAGPPIVNGTGCASVSARNAQTSEPSLPDVGDSFCDFQLLEELGRGAFARVFLARQTLLGDRLVALKVSRGFSAEPDRLAELQHSNIVPIYSVHQGTGFEAICMPYLGRHTLADVVGHVNRSGRLPRSGQELLSTMIAGNGGTVRAGGEAEPCEAATSAGIARLAPSIRTRFEHSSYVNAALWIVARLSRGLSHAHERGLVHRDLKPANVLISNDGRPMILDFNLSARVTAIDDSTTAGGTIPYMSPEQLESLRSGEAIDVRSDLYSLGVILFELLTGRLPFQVSDRSQTPIAELVAQRKCGAPRARALNRDVPRSIERVVERCLAFDRDLRYQSAADLADDLDRHLEDLPLRHVSNPSPKERAGKWMRRHPKLASAGSVVVFALMALFVAAGAWRTREVRLRRLQAKDLYHDFVQRVDEARIPLTLVELDAATFIEGSVAARAQLERFRILSDADWREGAPYCNLDPQDQAALDRELVRTLYLLAGSSLRQAAAETAATRRIELLQAAHACNAKAMQLTEAKMPEVAPAVREQQESIARWQNVSDADKPSAARLASYSPTVDPELSALQCFQQAKFAEAIPDLLSWRDSDRSNIAAWMLLGQAYSGVGDDAQAEICYTTCTRLRPQLAIGYLQRGMSRYRQKKYRDAAEDFSEFIKLKGTSSTGLINRALAYHELRDKDHDLKNEKSALDDLNAAEAAGATQTRLYFIRAAVRRCLNDPAGAQEDFKRGLNLTPSDSASWTARGIAQLGASPEQALADFRQARRLNPADRTAAQNILHVLCDRLNKDEEAINLLDELLATNPRDERALATRAVLHARQGDVEAAIADADASLSMNADPRATFQAACVYSQISRRNADYTSKALDLLARSLGAEPRLSERAATDPDLDPIRGAEAFQRVVAAAEVIKDGGKATEMTLTAEP
jgi:serine/threonine protein kinase/tetratricopeptide (TPR) repeat protein